MEELQDAIEDLQYIDATQDSLPRPTRHMNLLKNKELQDYMDKVGAHKLSLHAVCSEYTGFYLFKKFLEGTSSNDAKIYIEYAMDLEVFRSTLPASKMKGLAIEMTKAYLEDRNEEQCKSSRSSSDKLPWSHTMRRTTPALQGSQLNRVPDTASRVPEGKERGVGRVCPVEGEEYAVVVTPSTRVEWEMYMDRVGSSSALKIIGEPLKEVLQIVRNDGTDIRADVFDEIDTIVFAYMSHQYYDPFTQSKYWKKYFQLHALCAQRLAESDFMLYRVLGRGGFGLVNACKHVYTGKLYAMKMLNRKRVKMKKAEKLCLNERNIMASVNSPFIVCLQYAFATPTELFLIVDLMTGGDLSYHLGRLGVFSLNEARYYTARIVLGIAALHELNIVYRDLKPENVLMDTDGYTRLSDLGLSTAVGPNGISGCCGTRGYWAPEMVLKNEQGKRGRYGLAVDWFSLGCVLYEFLFGVSPFRTERGRCWGCLQDGRSRESFTGSSAKERTKAEKDAAIDRAILEMEPDWPDYADPAAVSLLKKLLEKNPAERLGGGRDGARAVMSDAFFATINWGAINSIPPPIKPSLMGVNMASQSDIGFFADESEYKKVVLSEEDRAQFKDWEFVSTKNYQMELVEFFMFEDNMGRIRVDDGSSGCCSMA